MTQRQKAPDRFLAPAFVGASLGITLAFVVKS